MTGERSKSAAVGAVARFRAKGRRCPICKKAAKTDHRPFCSKRCAQIDLGRWLGEVYRSPAEDDDAAESEIWSEAPGRQLGE